MFRISIFLLQLGFPSLLLASNLVVNGSFEEGPRLGETPSTPLPAGTGAIPGWAIIGRGIDYTGSEWMASHGRHSIDLEGSPGAGGVYQDIPTVPGQEYRLRFDLAGNPCDIDPSIDKRMFLLAPGLGLEFVFLMQGRTPDSMGWRTESVTFTAEEETSRIEFRGVRNGFCGAAIDDVRVTPVSVPFIRGDVSGDGRVNVTDVVILYRKLFLGWDLVDCNAASDIHSDSVLDITDGVLLLQFLFLNGLEPDSPFPDCGLPDDDSLECLESPGCAPDPRN